mmetsp:Transcript_87636/g.249256  ORF Transcript_87636/g.249256 Transcript_87636/m.249256 type:complete len:495 (-) Transcript_87636:151-1635(-)
MATVADTCRPATDDSTQSPRRMRPRSISLETGALEGFRVRGTLNADGAAEAGSMAASSTECAKPHSVKRMKTSPTNVSTGSTSIEADISDILLAQARRMCTMPPLHTTTVSSASSSGSTTPESSDSSSPSTSPPATSRSLSKHPISSASASAPPGVALGTAGASSGGCGDPSDNTGGDGAVRRRGSELSAEARGRKCTPAELKPWRNPRYQDLAFDNYQASKWFCRINCDYPGLQLIHEEPYIFIINNFLTPEECDAVVDKCETREPKPSVRSTETIVRTSMTSVAKNEEMAGFRCKVMELTNQTDEQLQYTKMTRYEEGQMFGEHLDASAHNGSDVFKRRGQPSHDYYGDRIIAERGMWTTRGNPCHNRFCTVFCYLNDVEEGGSTSFTWIGKHLGKDGKGTFYETPNSFSTVLPKGKASPPLRIQPERGMAVVHFPCTTPDTGGFIDFNTTHTSEPAVAVKYIIQQFIYSSSYRLSPNSKDYPHERLSETNC